MQHQELETMGVSGRGGGVVTNYHLHFSIFTIQSCTYIFVSCCISHPGGGGDSEDPVVQIQHYQLSNILRLL